MFLGFANFYDQFIKDYNKIAAPLIAMLKIIVPSISARPACIKANKNKLEINGGGSIGSGKIDNKMANLSSFTKKKSSRADFLIPKASLAFIQLRKIFTKAPILYYFDPELNIQIEIDVLDYAIGGVLIQLIIKSGLAD